MHRYILFDIQFQIAHTKGIYYIIKLLVIHT